MPARCTVVSNQVHEHGRAGVLNLGERLKPPTFMALLF